jgi:hypothetical protein
MATNIIDRAAPRSRPGRRYDNIFVSLFVAVLIVGVLWGFARTYFLAGVLAAPLPNRLIHVHGAVFTLWMILLIVQTALVSARRVDIHRKLGLFGFALAVVMVVLGSLASSDALHRGFAPPGFPGGPRNFFVVPMSDMLMFSVLIGFAYRYRNNSPVHKRLILIANLAIFEAALDRIPLAFIQDFHFSSQLILVSLLLVIALYDWWSTGKIYRATIFGGLFLIFVFAVRFPISSTMPWLDFAAWVQSLGI